MFERYTEQARRVLFFARYEASQLGSVSIEPQHLMLGLIRDGKGIVHRILASTDISLEDLTTEITAHTPFKEKLATSVEIPFTDECKRVLQFSAEEADRLLHRHIGAEHLLLGILREEQSVAGLLLRRHGLQLSAAREMVALLLKDMMPEPAQLRADLLAAEVPTLKLSGYTGPGKELFRNVLFDQLVDTLPRDPHAKVRIFTAEIAPGGYTNWHRHNGTTFFLALQGVFEAEFEEGMLVRAKAGDVYSEPIGKFHRGHNPHPTMPYLCVAVCITPPDREHITDADSRPW